MPEEKNPKPIIFNIGLGYLVRTGAKTVEQVGKTLRTIDTTYSALIHSKPARRMLRQHQTARSSRIEVAIRIAQKKTAYAQKLSTNSHEAKRNYVKLAAEAAHDAASPAFADVTRTPAP